MLADVEDMYPLDQLRRRNDSNALDAVPMADFFSRERGALDALGAVPPKAAAAARGDGTLKDLWDYLRQAIPVFLSFSHLPQ